MNRVEASGTNAHGLTLAQWLQAAHWPAQKPVLAARAAWSRGEPPPRRGNPVPLEPPAAEQPRLAKLTGPELARFHKDANAGIAANAKNPGARDQASRRACWALWEAERRGVALDRRPYWPKAKERATAAKAGARTSREKAGEDMGPRVPCKCGDGSCMLCDDQGMVPAPKKRTKNPIPRGPEPDWDSPEWKAKLAEEEAAVARGEARDPLAPVGVGVTILRADGSVVSAFVVEPAPLEQEIDLLMRIARTCEHGNLIEIDGPGAKRVRVVKEDGRVGYQPAKKGQTTMPAHPSRRGRGKNPAQVRRIPMGVSGKKVGSEQCSVCGAVLPQPSEAQIRREAVAHAKEYGGSPDVELIATRYPSLYTHMQADHPAEWKRIQAHVKSKSVRRGKNPLTSGPPLPGKLYEATVELKPNTSEAWQRLERHAPALQSALRSAGIAAMSVEAHPHRGTIAIRVGTKGNEKKLGAAFSRLSLAKAKVQIVKISHFHPLTRRTNPHESYEHGPECPMCGGDGVPMGVLGSRAHYSCRQCGMEFSHDAPEAATFKFPKKSGSHKESVEHVAQALRHAGAKVKKGGRRKNPSDSAPEAGPLPTDSRRLYEARVTVHPSTAWRELEGELERLAPEAVANAGLTFTSVHVHPHRKTIAVVLEAPGANEKTLDAVFRQAPLKALLGQYGLDPHFHIITRRKNPAKGRKGNPRKAGMTMAQARQILTPLGLVIKKTGYDNELRVSFKGATADEGYFTDDLDDAVGTGRAMAEQRGKKRKGNPTKRGPAKPKAPKAGEQDWNAPLTQGSRNSIRHAVGRLHVSEPESGVIRLAERWVPGSKKHLGTPFMNAVIEAALDAHWDNMRLYVSVMEGRELPKVRPSRRGVAQVQRAVVPPSEELVTRAMAGDPEARRAILGDDERGGNPVQPWGY